jgi:hypothetical protein
MERLYIIFYQMSNKEEFTESESISEGIKPAYSSTSRAEFILTR